MNLIEFSECCGCFGNGEFEDRRMNLEIGLSGQLEKFFKIIFQKIKEKLKRKNEKFFLFYKFILW